jgi:voltage-gated potassium channel
MRSKRKPSQLVVRVKSVRSSDGTPWNLIERLNLARGPKRCQKRVDRLSESFAMMLFDQIAAAVLLLSLTLCLQCGVTTLIKWRKRVLTRDIHKRGPVYSATLVVKSTVAIVILHGLVILLWASFYRARCFPSWELAFYFSASSYSTVGYGDLILPSNWRLLGPLEKITGVLMCGISVSVLFALVTWLLDRGTQSSLTNSIKQSHA